MMEGGLLSHVFRRTSAASIVEGKVKSNNTRKCVLCVAARLRKEEDEQDKLCVRVEWTWSRFCNKTRSQSGRADPL